MNNIYNINEQFKKLRLYLKLTQEDFANSIKTKRNSISMLESGRNNATTENITQASKAFEISPSYFFSSDEPEKYIKGNVIYNNEYNIQNNIQDDNLNSTSNDNLNSKSGGKASLAGVLDLAKAMNQLGVYSFENSASGGPIQERIKGLNDLKEKYYRRLNRELNKDNEQLSKLLLTVDNLGDAIEGALEAYKHYINTRPNPFDIAQYFDYQTKQFVFPDDLSYGDFKNEVVNWLAGLENFEPKLKEFYGQIEAFLDQVSALENGQNGPSK